MPQPIPASGATVTPEKKEAAPAKKEVKAIETRSRVLVYSPPDSTLGLEKLVLPYPKVKFSQGFQFHGAELISGGCLVLPSDAEFWMGTDNTMVAAMVEGGFIEDWGDFDSLSQAQRRQLAKTSRDGELLQKLIDSEANDDIIAGINKRIALLKDPNRRQAFGVS
jgi:hypothetical protein